jgi:hypothetical protein
VQLRIRAFGASAGIEQVGVQSPFIDHSGHFGEGKSACRLCLPSLHAKGLSPVPSRR